MSKIEPIKTLETRRKILQQNKEKFDDKKLEVPKPKFFVLYHEFSSNIKTQNIIEPENL